MLATRSEVIYRIGHADHSVTLYGGRCERVQAGVLKDISETELEEEAGKVNFPFEVIEQEHWAGKKVRAKILGWGCYSYGIRLETRDSSGNERQVVAVNKPLVGEALNDYRHHRNDPLKYLAPFARPYDLVIGNGFNNEPTLMRISKEVKGATLRDLSLLYLLGDREFLQQYVSFANQVVRMFINSPDHCLIDTIGAKDRNWLGLALDTALQLRSSNLMLDQESGKLVLIDCGTVECLDFFAKAGVIGKARLAIRFGGVLVGEAIARSALLGHKIGNLLEQEKHKPDPRREDDYRPFIEGFGKIVDLLNQERVDYRVVGSFAMAGHIQSRGVDYVVTPSSHGCKRDVDILLLDTDDRKVREFLERINDPCPDIPDAPTISFTIARNSQELKIDCSGSSKCSSRGLARVEIDERGRLLHKYKDLALVHNTNELEPINVTYDGVKFQTLRPDTLVALALTRMGSFKFKDSNKLKLFFHVTGASIPPRYLDFAREIRRSYPLSYRRALIREWSHFLPDNVRNFVSNNRQARSIFRSMGLVD